MLEILTAYNFRQHVASDIGSHGQYLPSENIKSGTYLEEINKWTEGKQMLLNKMKTKYMVINFTNKYKFNTRISLEGVLLEELQECRLLGVEINHQLTWHKNTESIVKKSNTRMMILHKLYDFNLPLEEMINIYILFIRSMVEYACVVWHSPITDEESRSIERVQKTALRVILKEEYLDYSSALAVSG